MENDTAEYRISFLSAGEKKRGQAAYLAAMGSGCSQDASVSRQEPRYNFVHEKPQHSDAVGIYVLTDHTLLGGDISVMQGRQCEITVREDGSASVTNYPDQRAGISADGTHFTKFISKTGTWRIGSPGSSHGKTCWGMRFSNMENKIAPVAFTGDAPPYGLVIIFGDPDSNIVMIFKNKDDT